MITGTGPGPGPGTGTGCRRGCRHRPRPRRRAAGHHPGHHRPAAHRRRTTPTPPTLLLRFGRAGPGVGRRHGAGSGGAAIRCGAAGDAAAVPGPGLPGVRRRVRPAPLPLALCRPWPALCVLPVVCVHGNIRGFQGVLLDRRSRLTVRPVRCVTAQATGRVRDAAARLSAHGAILHKVPHERAEVQRDLPLPRHSREPPRKVPQIPRRLSGRSTFTEPPDRFFSV